MGEPSFEIRRHKKIETLREPWQRICGVNELLSPYQSYEFCEIVARDFRVSRQRVLLKPVFFEILKDGRAIIIAPLWQKNRGKYFVFPDFCLTGYLDLIYDKYCVPDDFAKALALIKEAVGGAEIEIRRLRDQSLFGVFLRQNHEEYDRTPSIAIDFTEDYEVYYNKLSKSARQNIRTANNRIKNDGKTAELRVLTNCRPDKKLWDEITALHAKRRLLRDEAKNSFFENYVKRHHDPMERALKGLENNLLCLFYIDGILAADFEGFISYDGRAAIVPRLAFDNDFSFYSPGILLINEAVKYFAHNTGIRSIDLCHGEQNYKYVMGGVSRDNHYYRF